MRSPYPSDLRPSIAERHARETTEVVVRYALTAVPRESWPDIARRWVIALGVGAEWPHAFDVPAGAGIRVSLDGNGRLHVRLDQAGLFLTMRPPAQLRRPPLPVSLPLETLQLGFREGRLQARTGAPAALRPLVDRALTHALDPRLGDALPEALRRGGYHPGRDPDPAGTLRSLGRSLGAFVGTSGTGADLTHLLGDANDARAHIQLRVDEAWRWPVPDRPRMEVTMAPGTLLALHLHTHGPARAARLQELQLHAQASEVIVASTGGSLTDALTRVAIRRATIRPGPEVQLDTRMPLPLFEDEARGELEGAVTALVRRLARDLDEAFGGLDVPRFLGVTPAGEHA